MDALVRHWAQPLMDSGALHLNVHVHRLARDTLTPTRWQVHADGDTPAVWSGFDAVLMDIRMPGLSGYQTLAQMRQQGFGGYVMAISADVAPEKRAEALACGFDGYLTKPVEAERLLALLRNARTTTATGL